MKQIIVRITTALPFWLGRIPYDMVFHLVKQMAKSLGLQCWARNSYHLNYLTPGISDIDFTILVPIGISREKTKTFLKYYYAIKKIAPIVGEVNIYHETDFSLIKQWLNKYEIQRDPLLASRFSLNSSGPADKLVYLLRMLESDRKNLKKSPFNRERKWNFHLGQVATMTSAKLSVKSIIEAIASTAFENMNKGEFCKFLDVYLNNSVEKTYSSYRKEKKIKIFMILYPHRWLVHANSINDVTICLGNNHFSKEEHEIILSQLRWELSGIYSQANTLDQESYTFRYLEMIQFFLTQLNIEAKAIDIKEMLESIDTLKGQI
jgi:hypothetical protein